MELTQSYLESLLTQAIVFLPKLFLAIVIFLVSLYLAKLTARAVNRTLKYRDLDPELSILLTRSTRWAVIGLGIIVALQQVNFNVSSFIAGLGIIGFALGFAFQDIAKNFIAGVLLLLQQPFDIGDGIEVVGVGGTVEDIEIRSTALRTWDGKLVIIPNADVYTSTITNFSRSPRRRVQLEVGVAYNANLEQVTSVLETVINAVEGVLNDPAPTIVFNAFADSAINCTIYFWVDTNVTGLLSAKDTAVKAIKVAFEKENIDIPYPVQTVLLQQ